jgi:hypothetical protein
MWAGTETEGTVDRDLDLTDRKKNPLMDKPATKHHPAIQEVKASAFTASTLV